MRLVDRRPALSLVRRLLAGLAAALVPAAAFAAPAMAQGDGDDDDRTQIVLHGRAEVRPGERADTIVIFDGPADIAGHVDGAVIALNGDVLVTGTVEEAIVAVKGRVRVASGGRVAGDVVSTRAVQVDPGGTVEGETGRVRFSFRTIGVALWALWWVGVTLSALLIGVLALALAPAAVAASVAVARNEVGPALGWGLAITIGLPLISVVLLFTVVGLPLGLLGLLSIALLYTLGYVVASTALGRALVKEPQSRYLAFVAGLAILRVLGLIPGLGGLVTFVAVVYGLGALAIAGRRAARRESPAPVAGDAVA